MTDREQCINILSGMVDRGYNLMNRSIEEMVDMMGCDVELFKHMAMKFDQWAKTH